LRPELAQVVVRLRLRVLLLVVGPQVSDSLRCWQAGLQVQAQRIAAAEVRPAYGRTGRKKLPARLGQALQSEFEELQLASFLDVRLNRPAQNCGLGPIASPVRTYQKGYPMRAAPDLRASIRTD
jgi:hypothetical protein